MAKITGPLMSLDASGSVAGTITFSKWKGRNYVRQTVTPSNPKSPAQTAFRAMFGYLSQVWRVIEGDVSGLWEELGRAGNYAPFNAFVRFNQRRWTQVQAPTFDPDFGAGDVPQVISSYTATGGVRQIALAITQATVTPGCAVIVYRNVNTGFTPSQNDVVAVFVSDADTAAAFIDSNLTPGTYYYRLATFAGDGTQLLNATQHNATAS